MLTNIHIRNFKRLRDVEIELGKSVVLIGPNNSGKTAALQALALWEIGLRQWTSKRGSKASPTKKPGVAINRKDLISIPVPKAKLLWKDLHVREGDDSSGEHRTKNIRIDVVVAGTTDGSEWVCGFEFDYSNEESLICRPIREVGFENKPVRSAKFTEVPEGAARVRIAYLPPMSGLAAEEPKWEPGRVNVLVGEGQTAQVLRNLCYQIYEQQEKEGWKALSERVRELFGVELKPPRFLRERGEITMEYEEPNGVRLDLSCSGRGLQQTLLLLAHLYANPSTVLLLDEPDAHLEVFRQRQTYQLLTEVAEQRDSQIIAASHSEVVLNEAADKDIVVAFVGKPHRINDRGGQVVKALKEIGFDQYYLAEQQGWVLYLEGSTDMEILRRFAKTLCHEAQQYLERPFVHYVGNQPSKAYYHFNGLREAYKELLGIAIFDRIEEPKGLEEEKPGLTQMMWQRRELENYLCMEDVLLQYTRSENGGELFASHRETLMRESIEELSSAAKKMRKPDVWSPDIKATDDFLDPLFENYYEKLSQKNLLRKTNYHILAGLVPKDKIDREIVEKLNAIVKVAKKAKPEGE
jgi:energy-coupling factor transporter ATP-binding protein EcfA2